MNTDYRIPITYYSDPRTFVLKRKLGNGGLAALNFLWCWTAIHKANGILTGLNEDWIEAVSFWDGEHGKFVPTLLELEYLERLEDGTYAIHQWAEINPWAADAINREDKARLSNMARFYPELYEELTAQGATGISKEEYARLTTEYNRRGIICSSSKKGKKCDVFAPRSNTPTPTPAPVPAPAPDPVSEPTPTPVAAHPAPTESTAPAQESSSSRTTEKQIQTQKKTGKPQTESDRPAELTEAKQLTIPLEDSDKPEETPEPEATLEWVFQQWNQQLGSLGFQKVSKVTPRRKSAFKARLRVSQERSSRAWWIALFDKMAASDFMRESAAQKANWLTIDWPLNETNLVKILEGKYDNDRPRKARIHSNDGTKASATTQPTTIRRLTHEEISGSLMYEWEVEHGYDAAGRKKRVVLDAEVEDTTPDTEVPALSASHGEDTSNTEEASYDLTDLLDDDATADEDSYDYGTSDSGDDDDEDLTLYGDSGLPTIRRTKGAF